MPAPRLARNFATGLRSEEHTSELQSPDHPGCRLFLKAYGDHWDLLSFPPRRSSDLGPGTSSCPSRASPGAPWRNSSPAAAPASIIFATACPISIAHAVANMMDAGAAAGEEFRHGA